LIALEGLLDARQERDGDLDARRHAIGRELADDRQNRLGRKDAVEHDLERRFPPGAKLGAKRLELTFGRQ
jgi:hypothetical protein